MLGSVRHPLNNTDFSSFLLQAQASGAKVVGLANAGLDTTNSVKQAAEFGITAGGQKLAGLLMTLAEVHGLGLKASQGLVLTKGFYWDLDDQSRAFADKFLKRTNRMPNMIQAGTYSAVLSYLKAVKAADSKDTKKVAAKLKELPVDDVFGAAARCSRTAAWCTTCTSSRSRSPRTARSPGTITSCSPPSPARRRSSPSPRAAAPPRVTACAGRAAASGRGPARILPPQTPFEVSCPRSPPMSASSAILEARGLTKEFLGFVAVNNVDLSVRRGAIHALIGPNGAGKTTVFNLLTKFLTPTSGTILFDGVDVTGMRPPRWRGRAGAVLPDLRDLPPPDRAGEHPRRPAAQGGLATQFWRSDKVLHTLDTRARELIAAVNLEPYRELPRCGLSYGRKRALEIATTLALDP